MPIREPTEIRTETQEPIEDELDALIYRTRANTSTRRYQSAQPTSTHIRMRYQQSAIPSRAHRSITVAPQASMGAVPAPTHRPGRGVASRFLLMAGAVLASMVVGAFLLTWALSWVSSSQDDARYGRPRTFQCDAVVGHSDSSSHPSHFIAVNLNRQVQIIEFPGGDSSKAKVYTGPLLGAGQELDPVTLEFRDITGNGRLDMLIDVENIRIAFINDNGTFRPLREGEHVTI